MIRPLLASPIVQACFHHANSKLEVISYRSFRAGRIFLPVNIVDLLGEQLLTEVNPFLKITLRFAKAFMFGVLQTELL